MTNISEELITIYSRAIKSGVDVTLNQLINASKILNTPVLENINLIQETVKKFGLELIPNCTKGDLDSVRILRLLEKPTYDIASIAKEIQNGESESQEFKSSLMYDYQKAEFNPGLDVTAFKSEDVIFSTMKSIVAFLNCGGGILFVGVKNDGECIGLEQDLAIIKHGMANIDAWETQCRNYISGRFKDGVSINDYLTISFIKIEKSYVARIGILGRRLLSFIKKDGNYLLYRRQGNRSVEVKFEDIEEFVCIRIDKAWCNPYG